MLRGFSLRRKEAGGITGIETAIIMLAFIVVVLVLAYTVLLGSILSSN